MRIFALIIYKTLNSGDFNDLVKSKGDLYTQIKDSLEDNNEWDSKIFDKK